jgi:hypothetical protein
LPGVESAIPPESSSEATNFTTSASTLEQPDDTPKNTTTEFPYGLEVLHEPKVPSANPVQIIFVHGLGGSKRGTWTHAKTEFWPDWLHDEKGLEGVRLLAFGYNSAFKPLAPNNNLSIPIFADQLLDDMNDLRYRHGSVYPLVDYSNGRGGLFL